MTQWNFQDIILDGSKVHENTRLLARINDLLPVGIHTATASGSNPFPDI